MRLTLVPCLWTDGSNLMGAGWNAAPADKPIGLVATTLVHHHTDPGRSFVVRVELRNQNWEIISVPQVGPDGGLRHVVAAAESTITFPGEAFPLPPELELCHRVSANFGAAYLSAGCYYFTASVDGVELARSSFWMMPATVGQLPPGVLVDEPTV